MNSNTIKHFKTEDVELILLRLKLSDIRAEFWLDLDGFFNYSLSPETNRTLPLPKKSAQINWTRIDEVISQLAYDATLIYPESVFSFWYNQREESPDYDHVSVNSPHPLVSKD